jgi:hypothetical protein
MISNKYFGIIFFILSIFLLFGIFFTIGMIKNPFKRNELRIEKTNVLVDDIKIISQLFTSSYYTEIVVDTTKRTPGYFSDNIYELVIIARGTSYVGTDLSGLDTSKIEITKINGKLECTLEIPAAKIFNTVINPSGFTIFNDDGGFTTEEVQSLKNKAVQKIEQSALYNDILEKANKRSIKLFEDLLFGMGYSKVTIHIK